MQRVQLLFTGAGVGLGSGLLLGALNGVLCFIVDGFLKRGGLFSSFGFYMSLSILLGGLLGLVSGGIVGGFRLSPVYGAMAGTIVCICIVCILIADNYPYSYSDQFFVTSFILSNIVVSVLAAHVVQRVAHVT